MSDNIYAVISSAEHVDCFGSYTQSDPLCSKYCALRIRCAIEQDQNLRTEILDDLVSSEDSLGRLQ